MPKLSEPTVTCYHKLGVYIRYIYMYMYTLYMPRTYERELLHSDSKRSNAAFKEAARDRSSDSSRFRRSMLMITELVPDTMFTFYTQKTKTQLLRLLKYNHQYQKHQTSRKSLFATDL